MTPGDIALLLGIGLSAGILAGLLGIGGGVLIVPAMVLLAGFDQHVAQGTSLLVIIPAAVAGSWTHHRHGRLVLRDAAALAAGGVVGALLGSLTALSLDEGILRRLFAVLLVLVAIRMLVARRPAPTPEEPEAD
jgi:uncharacterized membrane protein YfcA